MSKKSDFDRRQSLFTLKVAACFFGLLFGFFILAPKASMQNGEITGTNLNVMINGNVYRPTPEPPKSTIRGRVVYADTGSPVRRAGLMLLPAKGFGSRENGGVTNERGEFEIKDVGEGRYFVSISTPGVLSPFSSLSNLDRVRTLENGDLANITKEFQEIIVNGITDVDVTIAARRGAAISGRITYADGEAAIGVRVEVLRKKDGQYNAVIPNLSEVFGAMFGGAAGGLKTDDRGVFRVAGLPAGEYVVRALENVSHNDKKSGRDDELVMLTGLSPNSLVATYYPNTNDVKKAETIKVELGQEHPEISISIPERAFHTIKGIVVNKATRQPLKDARLSIKSDDDVNSLFGGMGGEFGSKNQSDEQGRWNFKELPAGKYTLIVQPPYAYDAPDEKNPQKPKAPKLAELRKEIIIDEKGLEDLIIELGYGAAISGTISFDNQQNLPQSMTISAIDEKGKFSETASIYTRYTNDGKPTPKKIEDFRIEGIQTGRVFLNVKSSPGDGEEQENRVFYVKSILAGGKEINFSTLETKEGEEIKGVQIILSKDIGKLKGKVVRTDKSPAAGVPIVLVPIDKQKWGNFSANLFASTGGNGEFEVSGAPGEYYVVFQKDFEFSGEKTEKSIIEQQREQLEKATADAPKATIKAKETEMISLTLPE